MVVLAIASQAQEKANQALAGNVWMKHQMCLLPGGTSCRRESVRCPEYGTASADRIVHAGFSNALQDITAELQNAQNQVQYWKLEADAWKCRLATAAGMYSNHPWTMQHNITARVAFDFGWLQA